MVSSSDDNPFERSSAWPRMPQTPFRVGRLPAVDAEPLSDSSITSRETSSQQAITPLFVRPMATSDDPGLSLIRRPEPAETVGAPRPVEPDAGAEAPEPIIEVPVDTAPNVETTPIQAAAPSEPVFAQRTQRLAAAGSTNLRKRFPAIVATLVGLGGLIGLVVMLTGQGRAPVAGDGARPAEAPAAAKVPAASIAPDPAPVDPVPVPLEPLAQSTPTVTPVLERIRPTSISTPRAIQPSTAIPAARPPVNQTPSPSAAAIRDMFDAPVLTLPAARPPPVVAPAPKPPPEDPSAPITTRVPFS